MKFIYNELKCKLPSGGLFGYIHVANILVVTFNMAINANINIRVFESMIIFNIKNYLLIAIYYLYLNMKFYRIISSNISIDIIISTSSFLRVKI